MIQQFYKQQNKLMKHLLKYLSYESVRIIMDYESFSQTDDTFAHLLTLQI